MQDFYIIANSDSMRSNLILSSIRFMIWFVERLILIGFLTKELIDT